MFVMPMRFVIMIVVMVMIMPALVMGLMMRRVVMALMMMPVVVVIMVVVVVVPARYGLLATRHLQRGRQGSSRRRHRFSFGLGVNGIG